MYRVQWIFYKFVVVANSQLLLALASKIRLEIDSAKISSGIGNHTHMSTRIFTKIVAHMNLKQTPNKKKRNKIDIIILSY